MRSTTTTTGSRKRGRESTPVRATRLKTGRRDVLASSTEDLLTRGVDDRDMLKDNNSSVNGPLLLSDGLMLADQQQQQPPPLKNRKQQQQQQVANGFPVTVFPPADNNNSSSSNGSSPPPTAPVGAFQSPRHNNKNSRLTSSTKNSSSQGTVGQHQAGTHCCT